MGDGIGSLVMTLSEDPTIDSFEERKAALRDQVRAGGGLAITVFAADKLSDIVGLRRGIQRYGDVDRGADGDDGDGHGRPLPRVGRADRVRQAGIGLPAGAPRTAGPPGGRGPAT